MLPGKRCSAGRSRNTLSNLSGSMLAIVRASSPPSRFFNSYGPMKAFSIFTCWSSTIPMSSASGSLSSRRLASSLSVQTIGTSSPSLLHELVAEASLDAQVSRGDAVVERRRDLDYRVVLHVQLEHAADAAVGAHRLGDRLLALVPGAGLAHVVLALEHQRAGRADADAVAAVDAGRVWKRCAELGRYVGVEPTAGDAQRERVLCVDAARLDALVAEDAARVVAHIQLVVDLHGTGGGLAVRSCMLRTNAAAVDRRGRRPESIDIRAISIPPAVHLRRGQRDVHRRAQELQHHAAAVAHAILRPRPRRPGRRLRA